MSVPVTVEHIEKDFGRFAALRDVSLNVAGGELLALLGPSGSGKTTLLRVVAGLEMPDRGRVLFGDVDALSLPLRDRRVGFVFQHYALFKHMKVLDNIAFGLRARPRRERPPEAEIRRRAIELLELVQLQGLEDRFPAQLSGGQRQRVALARALAIEPRVLLLDEPFGALDAKVRKELRRWLRAFHDRTGHTTLFVTHDQDEALELADRVAILNRGGIEQVGSADEIYDRPASEFVCDFIGDSNRIGVEIRAGQAFFAGRPIFPLQGPSAAEGSGTLFVRPQHLKLVDDGAAALPGTVAALRRNGAAYRADVAIEGLDHPVEVEVQPDALPALASPVHLAVRSARVFPA